jgi:hypothetical protein
MMTLHYTNHRGLFLNLDSKDQIQTTADFSSILIRRTKLYTILPFAAFCTGSQPTLDLPDQPLCLVVVQEIAKS